MYMEIEGGILVGVGTQLIVDATLHLSLHSSIIQGMPGHSKSLQACGRASKTMVCYRVTFIGNTLITFLINTSLSRLLQRIRCVSLTRNF